MRGSMQGMPMPIRLLAVALLASVISAPVLAAQAVGQVSGTVYLERDGQGARSPVEPGLPGVVVSNGTDIVRTDAQGRFVVQGKARSEGRDTPSRSARSRSDGRRENAAGVRSQSMKRATCMVSSSDDVTSRPGAARMRRVRSCPGPWPWGFRCAPAGPWARWAPG